MTRPIAAILPAAAVALISATPLMAHPGHGNIPADQPAHYVFEPVHAVPLLLIVGAVAGVVTYMRRAKQR